MGLERHIAWEEDLLFPLFEAKTGMRDVGPTAVMRHEHAQIRKCLQDMQTALESGEGPTRRQADDLVTILVSHNVKEESILYPLIDQQATAQERERVFLCMQGVPDAAVPLTQAPTDPASDVP